MNPGPTPHSFNLEFGWHFLLCTPKKLVNVLDNLFQVSQQSVRRMRLELRNHDSRSSTKSTSPCFIFGTVRWWAVWSGSMTTISFVLDPAHGLQLMPKMFVPFPHSNKPCYSLLLLVSGEVCFSLEHPGGIYFPSFLGVGLSQDRKIL